MVISLLNSNDNSTGFGSRWPDDL